MLINHLKATYPDSFGFSVSHTTRRPRPNEHYGVDYFFVDKEFFQMVNDLIKFCLLEVEKKMFLEHNNVYGNLYGTHRNQLAEIINSGKICIMDIDVQGLRSALNNGLAGAFRMFITVPSIEELRTRLAARGTETEESVKRRLSFASNEIAQANKLNLYHYIVENNNKENFIKTCEEIVEGFYPFLLKDKIKI